MLAFAAALTLAACSTGGTSGTVGPTAPPTPAAAVTVTPGDRTTGVTLTDHVVVHANAPLADVQVNRAANATEKTDPGVLAGTYSADRRTWTSIGGLFSGSRYAVVASTSPAPGVVGSRSVHTSFDTGVPAKSFKVSWDPVTGQTVGVGAPISLTFSAPVPSAQRAAVQQRLSVTTDQPILGAWNWVTSRLVVWRPQQYWTPGTRVHVEANLAGYDAGDGRFGVKDRAMDFDIGSAQISKVDAATHIMRVYRNGQLLRTLPVSLGKPGTPSMDGPHNVLGKSPEVIMDSATVGIPKGNPDYYYEKVQWAVNYTSGGQYVHSAPWSVASQGNTNVSHGCVNASPVDAEWFYGISRLGDIVDISNTGRPPDTSQLGNFWSVPWSVWTAGSALPVSNQPNTTPSPTAGTASAPASAPPATAPVPGAVAAAGGA
ncbi:Ig-like domain-containing protein [Frankia sp. AgB32]|uniref:L,D-transpeptidase n=1 Tax=Frankia sp. AgB32 TaxID=631119 RepID=UPI00200DE6C9|nr:Ig-like domain-containing protein [Frankia sp. AgB32]MCK9894841.1 Ig-like domain-containing protein [Frankia sp. AgB32]